MKDRALNRVMPGILAILLLLYVGYQVYHSKHTEVQTETVEYYTASNSVQASVVALRNETLLKAPAAGAVDYIVSSGDKVCKDGVIAKIYANESQITAQHELEDTDSAITQLQNLQQPGSTYSFNSDTANERILSQAASILSGIRSGNLTEAFSGKGDILNLMNEKQIATGKVKNFNTRIDTLKAQREAFASKAGKPTGSVTSPAAGYFIQDTDGMENAFDISKITAITCSQIRSLQNFKQAPVPGTVGKIDDNFNWYLVCIVPYDQLAGFKNDSDGIVSVRFPFVSGTPIKASVAAVNQSEANGEAAVVLCCDEMNSALAGIRCETADISLQEYTGLRVSKKTIHYETLQKTVADKNGKKSTVKKEVEGVYVMHGSQINFRQIVPLFSTDSYVICQAKPTEGSLMTDETVKLYDEVVVEGTDLYDGKVVK